MIRVTVELVPHGDESMATKLGCLNIINDGTGTPEIGVYYVVLDDVKLDGGIHWRARGWRELVENAWRWANVNSFIRDKERL